MVGDTADIITAKNHGVKVSLVWDPRSSSTRTLQAGLIVKDLNEAVDLVMRPSSHTSVRQYHRKKAVNQPAGQKSTL